MRVRVRMRYSSRQSHQQINGSPPEFSDCHYFVQAEFDWAIIVLLCSLFHILYVSTLQSLCGCFFALARTVFRCLKLRAGEI